MIDDGRCWPGCWVSVSGAGSWHGLGWTVGCDAALQTLGVIGLLFGLVLLFGLTEHYGIRQGLARLGVLAAGGVAVSTLCEVKPVIGIGWVMLGANVAWLIVLRRRRAG